MTYRKSHDDDDTNGGEQVFRRHTKTAWDSTIGKYHLLGDAKNYTFGKGSRDGFEKMMKSSSNGGNNLGPIYDIPSSLGELSKPFSFPKSKNSYIQKSDSPGPIYPVVELPVDSPVYSFPKGQRTSPRKNDGLTPSPGTYFPNDNAHRPHVPEASMGGRNLSKKQYVSKLFRFDEHTPGPGSGTYNPQLNPEKRPSSKKQIGFTTSKRPPLWTTSKGTPDPGRYTPKYPLESTSKSYSIGRSKRGELMKKDPEIGCTYNPKYTLQTNRVQSLKFSKAPREQRKLTVQQYPGPGHYNTVLEHKSSEISMAFKEREFVDPLSETPFRVRFLGNELQKLENQGAASPGPKYIYVPTLFDGPRFSFALPRTTDSNDNEDNVGGGKTEGSASLSRSLDAINISDRMYLGHAMNISRTKGLDSPGPAYVPDDKITRRSLPTYSFGRAPRMAEAAFTYRQSEREDDKLITSENPGLRALSTSRSVTSYKMGPKSNYNSREQMIMKSLTQGLGNDSPGCKYLPKSIDNTSKYHKHSGSRFGGLT